MSGVEQFIAGPWGGTIAIAAMTVATFLCRIAGALVMTRVTITPRIERGLRALPGSIILATILPILIDKGPTAFIGIAATIIVMAFTRKELAGLAAGLGTLTILRALGF
ncbi:AzlD family protein [Microvirga flavescens]|uniref:AzlD family protein n=1 Tax=Microvirga flavescens TaxID=2249811 RepID=UPI000DD4F13F|nr:AzlD domain-containing protein [Microvirga flavescens]